VAKVCSGGVGIVGGEDLVGQGQQGSARAGRPWRPIVQDDL
jgi:hypothetical protein